MNEQITPTKEIKTVAVLVPYLVNPERDWTWIYFQDYPTDDVVTRLRELKAYHSSKRGNAFFIKAVVEPEIIRQAIEGSGNGHKPAKQEEEKEEAQASPDPIVSAEIRQAQRDQFQAEEMRTPTPEPEPEPKPTAYVDPTELMLDLIEEVKEYIKLGSTPERALELVRAETTASKQVFDKVTESINITYPKHEREEEPIDPCIAWFLSLDLDAMQEDDKHEAKHYSHTVCVFRTKDKFYLMTESPQQKARRSTMPTTQARGDKEQIKSALERWVKVRQEKQASRRAKLAARKAQNDAVSVSIGDIFYMSWGYDQTNVDYYEVVKLVGKSFVMLREIASARAEGEHSSVVACHGNYVGEAEKKKIQGHNGKPYFSMTSYANAYLWDGTPNYVTPAGYEH